MLYKCLIGSMSSRIFKNLSALLAEDLVDRFEQNYEKKKQS
jgi:hypothetical protein